MKALLRPTKAEVAQRERAQHIALVRNNMRMLYISCLAANRVFGAGSKRLHRYIDDMLKLSEEFKVLREDGVGDEVLLKAVRQIMPDVERLFPEEVEVV